MYTSIHKIGVGKICIFIKAALIYSQNYKNVKFYVIYYCHGKTEFSASLLQASVSQDSSEISTNRIPQIS